MVTEVKCKNQKRTQYVPLEQEKKERTSVGDNCVPAGWPGL